MAQHALEDDPVLAALAAAPIDDTPVSDEELASIAEGEDDVSAGRVVTSEAVQAALSQMRREQEGG